MNYQSFISRKIRKLNITTLLCPLILLYICSPAFAQIDSSLLKQNINSLEQYSANHSFEKIHIHTDRQWYGLGDTLWFKAYVVTGGLHYPSAISGVLYAELINPGDTVVQRLTLPVNQGITKGDFIIPYNYSCGYFRLKAYTRWMLNDSSDFYEQIINIGGLKPELKADKAELKTVGIASQLPLFKPDVQFFPEGGELVNGLRSKIALKIIGHNGLPLEAKGEVIDEDNNEVANFTTQHAGMGDFALTPTTAKNYRAKVTFADGNCYEFDLPKASNEGYTLSVNALGDSLLVKVAANDMAFKNNPHAPFNVIAQTGGRCYYSSAGQLTAPIYTTAIAKNRFPSGVVQFTLLAKNNEPVCERLVFVRNDDQLQLAISTVKQNHVPLGETIINLEAKKAENRGALGSFSVAVTDETKAPVNEDVEATIFTDLLFTSDLKGHIDNPNYYFVNETVKTRSDLDLLMLSQGYRRYEWRKILTSENSKLVFQPEKGLTLSGTITNLSNKPVPNGKIRLTSVKDYLVVDTVADANGKFTFNRIDFYDTTKVVINAKKAKGGSGVKIAIKQPAFPPIEWKPSRDHFQYADSASALLAAMQKTCYQSPHSSLKNTIQLKEVKIQHKRNPVFQPIYSENMKHSANLNGPGHADEVILGDKIMRGGGALLSQILPGKIFGVSFHNGKAFNMRGGISGPMSIYIEGAEVSPDYLDLINPNDIYSIEVLRSGGYLAIYGSHAGSGALIITLKHGVDSFGYKEEETVDGIITYNFTGYYKARQFYSPKYDVGNIETITDNRKTIYWNPDVITDADGKATFEYFNASSKGTYRVVVEGIDGYGNLGRQVFRYKVE